MKAILSVLLISLLVLTPAHAQDQPKLQSIATIASSELLQALLDAPWKTPRENASVEDAFDHLSESILLPVERDDFVRRLKYSEE